MHHFGHDAERDEADDDRSQDRVALGRSHGSDYAKDRNRQLPEGHGLWRAGLRDTALGPRCGARTPPTGGLSGGDIECLAAPVGGLRLPRGVLAGAAAYGASEVLLSTMETSRAIRALRSSQNDTM